MSCSTSIRWVVARAVAGSMPCLGGCILGTRSVGTDGQIDIAYLWPCCSVFVFRRRQNRLAACLGVAENSRTERQLEVSRSLSS